MLKQNRIMNNYITITATILFVSLSSLLSVQAQGFSDYYETHTIEIPKEIILEVGGMAFNDKGQLGVATRRGEVWLLDNPETNTPKYNRFASGLHEALGLAYRDGSFFTAQRPELTELRDSDGDGEADIFKSLFNWDLSGNYHEYSFGPILLPNGDMIVTLNCGFSRGAVSLRKWRGWMLKITPEGKMTPIAAGLRSPAGIALNKNGDIFYSENQGGWVGSGRVSHVEVGDFMGHPESLKWTEDERSPIKFKYNNFDRTKRKGETMYDRAQKMPELKLPSVWFPHAIIGISTSGMKVIPDNFGPYAGQMIVGDQGHSLVMRMSQEKVNGVYQGACFPFLKDFKAGVLRLEWSDKSHLYVGMTSRGWSSGGKEPYGLKRVEWTGKTPFDIKHIAVTTTGFEIEFTKPIDKKTAKDVNSYSITDFNYNYWRPYGSPIINKEGRTIQKVKILAGGTKVRLDLDRMKLGNIFQIKTEGVKEIGGGDLVNDIGYYTLNQLPGGKSFKPLVTVTENNTSEVRETPKVNLKRVTKMPSNWNENDIETIEITTVPVLQFSRKLIEVEAGTKVRLVFANPDDMLHNFLLVKPNTVDKVVKEAFDLGLDGSGQDYVPDSPDVLFHTKIIEPETEDTIYFEVPKTKGDYTFVCTFPGHGQIMRGIFRVK